ncbi:MAG: hypothetical protein WCO96_02875 [Actinomycetes bacterium]
MTPSGVGAAFRTQALSSRRKLAPLGSPAAFSWPVLLAYCPIGILIQVPSNASIYGGPLLLWLIASSVGMLSLTAVLVAAHSSSRRGGAPSPFAVLAWYASAGLAQGVTFGLASVLLGAAESMHLGFRLSGLSFQLPLLAVVGYAVARHDAHSRVCSELEGTRDRLLALGRSVEAELDRVEVGLTDAVRESLKPAVKALDAALAAAAAGAERGEALSDIESLVEKRVRPLAHELVSHSHDDVESERLEALIERTGRSRARVPLPERFRLDDGIKPGLTAFLTSIGALPSAVQELDPKQVLIYVPAVSLLAGALFALVKRALGSAQARPVLGAPAVVGLHVMVGTSALLLTGALGVVTPGGIVLPWAAGFALLGAAIVVAHLVEAGRVRSETELQVVALRLEERLALVRRRERLVRRRLAFVIHGALQGALHAATMRIAESEVLTERLGEEIRRDLGAAFSQLDVGTRAAGSLRTSVAIDELSSVWGRHRKFGSRIGEPVAERLACDEDADEAVAEVIREAVNNAFRHGAAHSVEVELELTGREERPAEHPEEIAISVSDDGTGDSGMNDPGLGSALFDDLCRTWALERGRNGTLFRARVALGAGIGPGDGAGGAAAEASVLG